MTPKPTPEKEADSLIALFQGCFNRRKELEEIQWKLNLSVWTSIGLAAWALRIRSEHLGCWSLAFISIPFFHWFATRSFINSIKRAVNLAFGYVKDLEILIGHEHCGTQGPVWSWQFLEVAPTVVLTVAAIFFVW